MDEQQPAPAQPPANPLAITDFPPGVQRSLDPKSPVPIRMMAAKGILVCPPRDFLAALFFLTFDAEPKVSETARASAAGISDKIIAGLRDEELAPEALDFYAEVAVSNEKAVELIALNAATPDATVARIAANCSAPIVEIISQNQLRILRDERIVRGIVANPNTRASVRDPLLDFCVRSGLELRDLPEYMEARRRVLGEDPVVAKHIEEATQHTVESVVEEFGAAVVSEDTEIEEEKKRLTFTQRVMKMSVAQKIKLATLGNKEARTLLLRDSNKLVCLAAVQSPRISDGEVLALSNSRTLHQEVMAYICRNREFLKTYQIKVNLVNNPKTPVPVSMKLIQFLHASELKKVLQNKNIAPLLHNTARAALAKSDKK